MVSIRFIVLLSKHPYFVIHALGASSRSAGQTYKKAVRWKQTTPIPKGVESVIVRACEADQFEGCEIVFSGLDSDVAGGIGESTSTGENLLFAAVFEFEEFQVED